MPLFKNIGEQLKALGQIIGEGARVITKGAGKVLKGAGREIREVLPFLRAGLTEAGTPAPSPLPLAPPRPTATGGVSFFDPTTGKEIQFEKAAPTTEEIIRRQQEIQEPEIKPVPISPIEGAIPTRPTAIQFPTGITGGLAPTPAPITTAPAPPPPPAITAGIGGGVPITGFGTAQRIAGVSTLRQAGQFAPQILEEERDERLREEEVPTPTIPRPELGFARTTPPFITPREAPTPPVAPQIAPPAPPERPTAVRFDEEGRMIVPTQLPAVSLATGRLTIPQITDEAGVISFAAQEAAREATEKLAKPGVKFTSQDLNDLFLVKKQEALGALQQTNPDLYNSIINPQGQVPTDETIVASLEPTLQERGRNILAQTPLEFLDTLLQQADVPNLLNEINLMRANIVAEAQAYDAMIADISDDPDFPKRLADRRITQIADIKSRVIGDMTAKLNFLGDQYTQQMNLVKLRLGLFQSQQEAERDAIEQNAKKNRDQLNTMISTGAIAQLTDPQLKLWADATGFTEESIRQIRDATAKREKVKLEGKPKAGVGVVPVGDIPARIKELADQKVSQASIRIRIKDEFDLTDGEAKAAVDEFFAVEPTVEFIEGLVAEGKTRSEIFSQLDTTTKLTATAINQLLDEAGVLSDLKDEDIDALIVALKSKIRAGDLERNDIIDMIRTGQITSGGRKFTLTKEQQDRILDEIRTFWQKLFPGGR